jgi:hypothetical protein
MDAAIRKKSGALTVCAYAGDGSVLLAMDLDRNQLSAFADFSILCAPTRAAPVFLPNRRRRALAEEKGARLPLVRKAAPRSVVVQAPLHRLLR